MRFSQLSVIAVYAATFASAHLIPRQTSTFQDDLSVIYNALGSLKTAIDSFTGAVTEAIAVSSAASNLQTGYETALTDANAATDLESQSAAVAAAAQALVAPHADGLAALIAKEPLFEAGGYNPLVLSQLQALESASSQLLTALAAKISDDISSSASAIEDSYDAAIVAFT